MNRIPKNQNSHADSLATLASSSNEMIPHDSKNDIDEIFRVIEYRAANGSGSHFRPGSELDGPYIAFLPDESLPKDGKEAEKV